MPSRSALQFISEKSLRLLALLALTGVAQGLCGCATVSYLVQAGKGQLAILNRARPISEVLKDEKLASQTRLLLESVEGIKKFGEERGGLKPTRNYADYVALGRPAANWVVSASLPLKFEAKQWSFPIVGSFTYLGLFELTDANAHAEKLKAEGLDVYVRGAGAYSTLGWFKDPIFSSMLGEGEAAIAHLANVILHESVHATIYIPDQSTFNESLASFIADELTLVYLRERFGLGSSTEKAYLGDGAAGEEREKRFHEVHTALAGLYASNASDLEKTQKKADILEELKKKTSWKRELNNAVLIQYATYGTGKVSFDGVLKKCAADWKRFVVRLGRLSKKDFPAAQASDFSALLKSIEDAGCG